MKAIPFYPTESGTTEIGDERRVDHVDDVLDELNPGDRVAFDGGEAGVYEVGEGGELSFIASGPAGVGIVGAIEDAAAEV